jgi:galactose mutarotase-like enzyme
LEIAYKVINKDTTEIPFSIGAHPAFALPKPFEDYQLRFEKEEEIITYQLENDLISDKTTILPLIQNNLNLNYALFENDALIIKKMNSNFITIIEKSKPILRIKFEDFPNLGIWTKNNAPFICIEPWQGYSDTIENSGDLFEKEGIQIVNANENFNCEFSIEIL